MSWWEDAIAQIQAQRGGTVEPEDVATLQNKHEEDRASYLQALDEKQGRRMAPTDYRPFDSQTTDPSQQAANLAADQAHASGQTSVSPSSGAPSPTPAPAAAQSAAPGPSVAMPSDFGAAPAPFGETYAALARPAWLQGPYTPLQWTGGDFAAPAKPNVLQTPYALPTQAELEASPGYLSGQTAVQRGLERSAAAKGSILSGGFVGRTLPRAMNEYAGTAYGNLVNQTLGARQEQFGEYSTDVNNAFAQYQQRYGQFSDAASRDQGARAMNESAYVTDESNNRNQYMSRYNQYLDTAGLKRQSDVDLWGRTMDLGDLSLRAAALARP